MRVEDALAQAERAEAMLDGFSRWQAALARRSGVRRLRRALASPVFRLAWLIQGRHSAGIDIARLARVVEWAEEAKEAGSW